MNDFTTEIKVYPSYDHREESHNKGCRSASMSLILYGPDAVLTTDIFTDWMAAPLDKPYLQVKGTPSPWPRRSRPGPDSRDRSDPQAAGTFIHSLVKAKEWWTGGAPCPYLDDKPCFGDGGYMVSDKVLFLLVSEGSDAAFAEMRDIYTEWMKPDEELFG